MFKWVASEVILMEPWQGFLPPSQIHSSFFSNNQQMIWSSFELWTDSEKFTFSKNWEKISYLFIEIWCHLKITDDLSAGFWTENLGNNWFGILLDSSCIDLLMIRKNSCRDFSQCINSQLRIHFYQIGCITFIAELRFSRIEIVLKLFCFFGFNMTQ